MPTYGWLYEEHEEHHATDHGRASSVPFVPQRIPCPFCARTFELERQWRVHLATAHPIEPPVLLLDRRPAWKHEQVRRRLRSDELDVANTSLIRLRGPDGSWRVITQVELAAELSAAEDEVFEIELVNERGIDGATATRSTIIHIEVPTPESLDAVDRVFRELVAVDDLGLDAIVEFDRRTSGPGGADRYRSALGEFAVAICARSGRTENASRQQADEKLRRATEVLLDFPERSVACVACATARLALGDVSAPVPATGVASLDAGLWVARGLAGETELTFPALVIDSRPTKPLCPVDPDTAALSVALASLGGASDADARTSLARLAAGSGVGAVIAASALIASSPHGTVEEALVRRVRRHPVFGRRLRDATDAG